MAGNIFGKNFTVTTWGEPGNGSYGCVIDGCPAGLALSENDIRPMLLRRFPDADKIPVNPYGVPMDYGTDAFGNGVPIDPFGGRMETSGTEDAAEPSIPHDEIQILSGVFEGRTTGAPVSILIRTEPEDAKEDLYAEGLQTFAEEEQEAAEDDNLPTLGYDPFSPFVAPGFGADTQPQKPCDPADYKDLYRPGHADYTYEKKYGSRDWRGGRASGQETVARIAAGAVACKLLAEIGVHFETDTGILTFPQEGDSAGGMIECVVTGMPAGVGEPVFDKLDAKLAHAVMSIGAIKSFEIGAGGMAAQMSGSFCNDAYAILDGRVSKLSNYAGGVLGGISDGDEIIVKAAVKPAPSINVEQQTINQKQEEVTLQLAGRHASSLVEQTAVVVEAMVALTLADLLFENMHARLTDFSTFYRRGEAHGKIHD